MTETLDRLPLHELGRARAAADHALAGHPGPAGQLNARELLADEELGWRFPVIGSPRR